MRNPRVNGLNADRMREKLLLSTVSIDEWELFDLKNDPSQLHNVYGKPGYEKVTKKLKKELVRLQTLYDDPIESELN